MKCKQCDNALTGRQREYCSDKCRKQASRTKPTHEDGPGSPNADKMVVEHPPNADISERGQRTRTASFDDYWENPNDYVSRQEPDKLNWGAWMSSQQLSAAGLKGNRVTLPGDWDYDGICFQDSDGVWKVGKDTRTLDQLSGTDLQLKLKSYEGASWVNSPEHKEVLRRKATQHAGAAL